MRINKSGLVNYNIILISRGRFHSKFFGLTYFPLNSGACRKITLGTLLEGHEMRKARTKSNPFEIIQGVFFLNRAAMKMAEMDAMFDYIFTSPKDKGGLFFLSHKRKLDFMLKSVF